MVGIVITGHGHFPSGIMSAVELVAGKPEQVAAVDFEAGQSGAELKAAMKAAVEGMEEKEVLILADLVGGTPFNTAAALTQETGDRKLRLLAGTNMPMVVEAVFSRMAAGLDELAAMTAEAGGRGVVDFSQLEEQREEPEFEDGV